MNPPSTSRSAPGARVPLLRPLAGALLLLLATLLVYANSLQGSFIFDDIGTIRDNPTIRQLWPPWQALSPPHGQGLTSNGRPLVNLSLAINYAIGGNTVASYHALNLVIHLLAGLTLYGIVRRTLLRSESLAASATVTEACPPKPWGKGAGRLSPNGPVMIAFAIALLWSLHPLATESVTYIVQRAESMMALFYLLTIYCFIRAVAAEGGTKAGRLPLPDRSGTRQGFIGSGSRPAFVSTRWMILSVLACLCGMASKEVMISAPLIVILFDRTFVSGSFREAWRRHRNYFLALAATWILLAYELAITGNRHGTAGFGTQVGWWPYALTQFTAIVRYLRLCFWPHPLVFDYGVELVTDPLRVVPCALLVLVLLAATVVALVRRPVLGLLGACFFALLAPTSTFVPVATQVMAEHRMYLPLVAVVAAVVLGAARAAARLGPKVRPVLCGSLFLIAAGGLAFATVRRNQDYRSEFTIWGSAIAGYPNNPRSHSNFGYVLANRGQLHEAMAQYQEALRIHPYFGDAQNNLGAAYFQLGNLPESILHYREALQIDPKMAGAHYNLGNSLVRLGQVDEGLAEFQESLRLEPSSPEAHYNLATSLVHLRRFPEAIPEFQEALRIRPDYTEARNNLATALLQTGRVNEAFAQYQQALAADPNSPTAHFNLANILAQEGKSQEALSHYRRALAIEPNYAKAHCNLGSALVQLGQMQQAAAEYREALRIDPQMTEARHNLARVEAYLRSNP